MKKLIVLAICFLTFDLSFGQIAAEKYLKEVRVDFNASDLITEKIIAEHQILLIGETHGFSANYDIATRLIAEYKKKTDFQYILAEMDWASAQRLNQLILGADSLDIVAFMNESKGSPAWCKERYAFYQSLISLNQEHKNKIQYIGVDIPSGGIRLALEIVRNIRAKYHQDTQYLDSVIVDPSMNRGLASELRMLQKGWSPPAQEQEDAFEYGYHINNLLNYRRAIETRGEHEWDLVRDSCMFANYVLLEQEYDLTEEPMMGVWGVTHTYQRASEGIDWFASSLRQKLNKNVHSYRIFCLDSQAMFPASWLPGFMKIFKAKDVLYYQVKLLNDDGILTGKKAGLKEMAKTVESNRIVFYDLEQEKSPYKEQPLLVSSRKKDWVTTDYFQTAIVVKNSAGTSPLGENVRE